MALLFLRSIGGIIPCPKCAKHYKQNFSKFPIKNSLNSREQFVKWFINFHNVVNKMLRKKIIPIKKALILVETFQNKNIIDHLDNVLKYAMHILPKRTNAPLGKKKAIQNFIKSTMHLARIKKSKLNLIFSNRKTYQKMHKKFIGTLKK